LVAMELKPPLSRFLAILLEQMSEQANVQEGQKKRVLRNVRRIDSTIIYILQQPKREQYLAYLIIICKVAGNTSAFSSLRKNKASPSECIIIGLAVFTLISLH